MIAARTSGSLESALYDRQISERNNHMGTETKEHQALKLSVNPDEKIFTP